MTAKRRALNGLVHVMSAANPGYFIAVCDLATLHYGSRTPGADDQASFANSNEPTTCVACVAYMLVR